MLVLTVALLADARAAHGAAVLDEHTSEVRLGRVVELLEDPEGTLTLADVTSPRWAGAFVPATAEVPNRGLTRSAWWVRFAWRTDTPVPRQWLLEVASPLVDVVSAWLPLPDGTPAERRAGDAIAFASWDVPYRNPTFRLALPAHGAGTIHLRFAGEDTMLLPLTIWSEDAFEAKRRGEAVAYGFFYGVVAILIAYNLALWIMLRDRSYVDYVLLIAAWGFYHASLAGFSTQYLWASAPALARWTIHLAAGLAFTCSAVFARSFLLTRLHAPALDRCLGWLAALGAVFLLWPLFGSVRWFIVAGSVVGLTGTLLLLASGFSCWRAGYRPARYYLVTWTIGIFALFVWALRGYGLAPSNLVTDRAFELVVLSTAITLSLGLADRVNVLKGDLEVTVRDKERLLAEVQELNRGLERRIAERTTELALVSRHKSEFLANMSHELRTPLNAVIGFSEVLLARIFGELNPKQHEYVADIHDSGRHLLSLINDILDLSKVEAGRMELELSRFDLPSAVENAVTLVRERAHRHGITLATRLDDDVGELLADERKVKQVLVNLLANAVKFTPAGGTVEVRAYCRPDAVEIAVRDTGIGIALADQAAIFDEFRQVGSTNGAGREGTGLGLSLARRMVELHGGRLRVSSVLGQGATFTFDLPRTAWQPS